MGRAEEIFQDLQENSSEAVERWLCESRHEEAYLDFKTSKDAGRNKTLSDDDRKNLRKALSGFANSEGGVILWGIKASSTLDLAEASVPLAECRVFAARLDGAVSGCTVPPCQGVRNHPIPRDSKSPEGYVATYIPKSTDAPHQVVGEGRYYIRAGSSFQPAPHGVVAGLFGRAPQPEIEIEIRPGPRIDSGRSGERATRSIEVSLYLSCTGPTAARGAFLSVRDGTARPASDSTGLIFLNTNERDFKAIGASQSAMAYIAQADFVLPPFAMVRVATPRLVGIEGGSSVLQLEIRYGCEGAPPKACQIKSELPIYDALKLAESWPVQVRGDRLLTHLVRQV